MPTAFSTAQTPPSAAPGTIPPVPSATDTPLLTAALRYASRKWCVLPCVPKKKRPLTDHAALDATTDAAVIQGWYRRWPNANLAIATGAVSGEHGLIGMDVDRRKNGHAHLATLETQFGPLPKTVQTQTPDGTHYYFRYPQGIHIHSPIREPKPGLQIKADRGYLMLPPSIHPSGQPYVWVPGHSPEETPLADLPGWLLLFLCGHTLQSLPLMCRQEGRPTGEKEHPENPPEAREQIAERELYSLASGFEGGTFPIVREGLTKETLRALLRRRDVVERCLCVLGLGPVKIRKAFSCPFHPPDKKPSASIQPPLRDDPTSVYRFVE